MRPFPGRALPGRTRARAAASSPTRPDSSRPHPVFPARLEQFAQMRAGAVEPRADRADWQLESLGYALVREILPGEEQERLALAVRQRLDRVGHAWKEPASIEHRRARTPVRHLASRRHPGA